MKLLRANTAVDVLIGPFVDSTDGNTDETGLTISQADVRLSKNGQNMAQKNDANACTHDELGYYNCPLDTTDTNTEGQLDIIVHESGALQVKMECMVLAEAAYDSLFTAKDDGYMDVNIKAISEDETAADNAEAFFDGTGYAGTNNVIPTVTTLTGHTPQTADHTANIAAILTDTGTTLNDKIDVIDGIVDNILTDTGTTLNDKIDTIDGLIDQIIAKLPSKDYLTGTANADGDIEADEMTGEVPATISSAAITEIASQVSTDAFGNIIQSKLLTFLKS
jgi:hypothetical protein